MQALKYSLLAAFMAAVLFAAGYHFLVPYPVTLAQMEKGSMERMVTGPGRVEADIQSDVSPQLSGKIESMKAREGDRVSRGEILFELDARERAAQVDLAASRLREAEARVESSRAEKASAEADLALANWDWERDSRLFEDGHIEKDSYIRSQVGLEISRAALDGARATLKLNQQKVDSQREELRHKQILLDYCSIESPLEGMVVSRNADVGEMVSPDRTVYSLIDPDTLQVSARMDESLAGRIRQGQEAIIELRSGPTLSGRVSRMDLVSDAATREMTVYVSFDSAPERFALNQEARVSIRTEKARGIVLPTSSLKRYQGETGAMLIKEGRASFLPVQTGPSREGKVLIEQGLEKDSNVILEAEEIQPGQRVRSKDGG